MARAFATLSRTSPDDDAIVRVFAIASARALFVAGRRLLDLEMRGHAAGILADDAGPRVILNQGGGTEGVARDIADTVARAIEREDIAVFRRVDEHLAREILRGAVGKGQRRTIDEVALLLHPGHAGAQAQIEHSTAFACLFDEPIQHGTRSLGFVAALVLRRPAIAGDGRIFFRASGNAGPCSRETPDRGRARARGTSSTRCPHPSWSQRQRTSDHRSNLSPPTTRPASQAAPLAPPQPIRPCLHPRR